MKLPPLLCALALSIFSATACDSDSGGLSCPVPDDNTSVHLVDHDLWRLASVADDPWAELRPEEGQTCQPGDRVAEDFAGTYSYAIDTVPTCGYTTVVQPLLVDVCAGDRLFVWLWRFNLTGPEDSSAHIVVQIGDDPLWAVEVPIPADSKLYTEEVPLTASYPAGTPIYYHVRNHGSNSYNLLEISVKR